MRQIQRKHQLQILQNAYMNKGEFFFKQLILHLEILQKAKYQIQQQLHIILKVLFEFQIRKVYNQDKAKLLKILAILKLIIIFQINFDKWKLFETVKRFNIGFKINFNFEQLNFLPPQQYFDDIQMLSICSQIQQLKSFKFKSYLLKNINYSLGFLFNKNLKKTRALGRRIFFKTMKRISFLFLKSKFEQIFIYIQIL
ncbi:unnamed protein product [Paramecium sonneborni]|uniref:Transmembrane protein n=1 Tax=Paramecium sonneborni TaxID=65129 RepID=A0A8S1KQT4_9CILI|nr:unnamed protein product [Paramecium sonneborni]